MTAPVKQRPLCRWCAKPIKKRTTTHWVRRDPFVEYSERKFPDFQNGGDRVERVKNTPQLNTLYGVTLRSKEECQRVTNEKVVSVRYSKDRTVWTFSTWDGVSYASYDGAEHFCSIDCAASMGVACAMAPHSFTSRPYREAMAKREAQAARS